MEHQWDNAHRPQLLAESPAAKAAHLLGWGKEKAVHALGLGAMLQVGVLPSQEVGCDAAHARAVAAHHQPGWCQMLPHHGCLCICSQCLQGRCSGVLLARGHTLEGRRLWGGRASACLLWFASELRSGFHGSRFRQLQPHELGLQGCCGSCWQA